MNTLTTEQKARIFAMHLGCRVFHINHGMAETLEAVKISPEGVSIHYSVTGLLKANTVEETRLLLRPVSTLSNEDAILVADVCWDAALSTEQKQWMGKAVVTFFFTDYAPWDDSEFDTSRSRKQITNCSHSALIFVYQLLIQLGYAVPLFVAPKHPDNRKTAIQMGIAIDSSTL